METKKIASPPTQEGILNLLNKYCYSTQCRIDFEAGECFNYKGLIQGMKCEFKKGRYFLTN